MDDLEYTLREICRITEMEAEFVQELVDLGVIEPVIRRSDRVFGQDEMIRCLRAERLRREFELDTHGVALAMELLERNQRLRRRVRYLENLARRLYD